MSRLTNAFHASFHHTIVTQIQEVGDESLGLPSEFTDNYESAVNAEQDVVNRTLGSAKTEALREQDGLRDKYFRSVRNSLKNAKYSSSAEIAKLYDVINKKLLKPYPGSILSEGDHKESSLLRGFIYDVKQFVLPAQRTALGIEADLNALETANESFESIYLERVEEAVQNPAGYAAKCREKVDEYWSQLVRTINFYANETSHPSDSIKAIATNAVGYLESLNKHIATFWRSVNATGSSSTTTGTTTGTDTPATGDDQKPSTDKTPNTNDQKPTEGDQKPSTNQPVEDDKSDSGYKEDL